MARGAKIRRLRPIVLERDGHRCVYCQWSPLEHGESLVWLVMDHRVPHKHGGQDTIENLVTACNECNTLKGAKTVEEFITWMEDQEARTGSRRYSLEGTI